MTKQQFISGYLTLARSDQIRFLAFLAAQLTVHARGTYEVGTDRIAQPERLREINEFQHRIAFHLFHLLRDQPQRYPEDVFAELLVDYAEAVGAVSLLKKSLDVVASSLSATASAG